MSANFTSMMASKQAATPELTINYVAMSGQVQVASSVRALVEWYETLFVGSWGDGTLYYWDGLNSLQIAADPYSANDSNIAGFAELDEVLYAASAYGRLLRFDDVNEEFVMEADRFSFQAIALGCFLNFGGELYAGTSDTTLMRWDAVDAWEFVASNVASFGCTSLLSLGGSIYCTTGDGFVGVQPDRGSLQRWNGTDEWENVAPQFGAEITTCAAVHDGQIWAGTESGVLLRWNGTNAWVQMAASYGGEIYSIASFNGDLMVTTTDGTLLRFNPEGGNWDTITDTTNGGPNQKSDQTRLYGLYVYDAKLFMGTFPDGLLLRAVEAVEEEFTVTVGNEGLLYGFTTPPLGDEAGEVDPTTYNGLDIARIAFEDGVSSVEIHVGLVGTDLGDEQIAEVFLDNYGYVETLLAKSSFSGITLWRWIDESITDSPWIVAEERPVTIIRYIE
jgi:hypothetical protein